MGDDNDSGNGAHYLTEEEIKEFEKEFSGASSDTVKGKSTLGSSASKDAAQQSSSGSSGRRPKAGADLGVGQGGPGPPWQIFTYESH